MSTKPDADVAVQSHESAVGSDAPEEVVASRRALAGVLGALGMAALAGCTSESTGPEAEALDIVAEALTGTATAKVADTAAQLRTITGGTTLWVAVLQGINAAADGGGGVFYWSTSAKADDGWSVLNSGAGNSAGWRRVNPGFTSVASVTALRALPGGSARSVAILTAYATPGDGGGGVFVWSTTAAPDDGGTVLNASAGNSAGWRRVYSGALNVRWFGAKGDATTDDVLAIRATIAAAIATFPKGCAVYFPAGVYKVAGKPAGLPVDAAAIRVPPNTTLYGDGMDSSVIYQAGITMTGAPGAYAFTGSYRLIDLTSSAPVAGYQVQNAVIERLGFWGDNGPTPVHPDPVLFPFRQPQLGIQAEVFTIWVNELSGPSSDVTVRHCKFLSMYGFPFRNDGNGRRQYFNYNVCINNGGEVNLNSAESQVCDNILDHTWGIECANQRIHICRNVVTNAGNTAVSIGGDGGYQSFTNDANGLPAMGDFGCMVTDNIIDNPAGLGIAVGSPVVGCIIARNQITRVPAGLHGIGFTQAFGALVPSFCKVEDNVIQSVGHIGIWCGTGGYGNVFRRNKITMNALAGALATHTGIYIGPAPTDGFVVEDNEARGVGADIVLYAAANCRVSGNTGNILVQGTGNSFIAEESGAVTISDGASSAVVTMTFPRTSASAYRVQVVPTARAGAPAVGSNRVLSVTKTAADFTIALEAAPGAGSSVTFEWSAVPNGIG